MTAPYLLSATDAIKKIQSNELTAEQLVRACIEHIEEKEPITHAWVSNNFPAAIERARYLDRSANQGMLHGIPFGAKDLFDTHDFATSYGSPIYANNRPSADAVHIAMMRQAGGVLLGKTVTTEFATFKGGPTTNPANPKHTPGGSSSGSAAAVADFMVPLATGSQTAGSIIRPASFCGVIGYKPTFGKISLGGSKSLSPSLDTLGSFSRTVEDAALCVAAMTGDRELANIKNINAHIKIATCLTADGSLASKETIDAIYQSSIDIGKLFNTPIADYKLPALFSDMSERHSRIMSFEATKSFTFEQNNYSEQLSQQLKGLIKLGNAISYESYSKDLEIAQTAQMELNRLFNHDVDILITPSAIGEAPKGLAQTGDPIFCRTWTLMGLPCITLPLHLGPNGLPIGIQLVAGKGRDSLLLSVAHTMMNLQR
ncbi:amidase [Polynucleobacter sp. MWH-Spelu-300-X4]|uniref:amidase n=1 Tax=Polynucleobacter sp. MWH-Spelu-300-X4 TaxID=2689109 RepID=UPI001BFE8253|nr:amidase [Polynucleobacter sp. MWH-Spelu-300-X4]QWD79043.1 amidase [Polynucleobacter sp. MWH-Spelu-300-X4]